MIKDFVQSWTCKAYQVSRHAKDPTGSGSKTYGGGVYTRTAGGAAAAGGKPVVEDMIPRASGGGIGM
jgi:hypothetical protein